LLIRPWDLIDSGEIVMNQKIGKQFPDFQMLDHDSQPIKLSQYAGKFPLILSFYRGYW
jgi:peroxiredoxin